MCPPLMFFHARLLVIIIHGVNDKKVSLKKILCRLYYSNFLKVYGFDIPNNQVEVLLYAKFGLY